MPTCLSVMDCGMLVTTSVFFALGSMQVIHLLVSARGATPTGCESLLVSFVISWLLLLVFLPLMIVIWLTEVDGYKHFILP